MKDSSPGPAMLPAMGRLGAGHCTIFSQHRQDFFSLATSMIFNWAAIRSRISLTSSPNWSRLESRQNSLSQRSCAGSLYLQTPSSGTVGNGQKSDLDEDGYSSALLLRATMSQKSSLPQVARSVSGALPSDTAL